MSIKQGIKLMMIGAAIVVFAAMCYHTYQWKLSRDAYYAPLQIGVDNG